MQALRDCIKEIRDDPNISTWKEARVQLSIILRILKLLDWDIFHEIIPEYDVENGSVDYALQIKKKNKVFIEAKSPKKNLNRKKYQEQLFNYSARKNPDLAILTDGTLWWFYLPRAEGDWNDRKFYTINILEQEIEDIVDKFDLLLSRQNIASGKAVQQAESILKSRRRERLVSKDFPQLPPTKRPEYDVENGSVDYALQIKKKNKVFIEAKSPKKNLNRKKYQEQLFNYSARKNPDLAILTDGTLWWFYLPRAEGDWNDRKFYTINILEQEIEDIVDKFDLLLSRQNIASGKAVQQAESILKSRRRERLVSKDFHIKPSRKTNNQKGKPKRMQIGNENYELKYKKEILINTANWLIDKGDLKSADYPVDIGIQSEIIVIDKNPNTLKEPQQLKNGLYIEYQYSRRAPEFAQRLLKKYDYDPAILKIEH